MGSGLSQILGTVSFLANHDKLFKILTYYFYASLSESFMHSAQASPRDPEAKNLTFSYSQKISKAIEIGLRNW